MRRRVRRDNFRAAFDGFDAQKIANYDAAKLDALMQNPGIVRNRLKIEGTVRIMHEPYDTAFELPWRATRSATTTYFAPTGVSVK